MANVEEIKTPSRGLTHSAEPQQYQTPKSYPFPTEVISLPSKGLCYPETSPLSKGEITIKLMTAKEEDILTSTNLIKKGIQLDKLLESIVVEPGVNINDLIIGDKNAILVTSRILAFGSEYQVKIQDPFDGEEVDVTIDLSKIKIKEIDESILNRNNEYEFILPVSKTSIKFKLLTHGDELLINKDIEASQKTLKTANEITTRYRRIITEVDGNRDFGFISNFVANQLLAGDSKSLRKYIASISPDLDLKFDYTSPVTGDTEALRIPFGIGFFYPTD
ncbi:hypothetical protein UFOVP449_118 [uncultured Caudovirales phage]|uniref:Uncharacterized protein n=1 Tax=uncultured Caudovirales phage TaxID=2100421 RepID=A0A6J5MDS1_9CAUD|nr:hypothetical protein UFOVP449_118 [uncultured Caudovirales phage]